jgi:hypothetical protein
LFVVPSVVVDSAILVLELVGAWSEHFCDDIGTLQRCDELVAALVALDKAENKVTNIEGSPPYATAVVPA